MQRAIDLAVQVAKTHAYAAQLLDALDKPFAGGQWNDLQTNRRLLIAYELQGCGPRTIAALHAMEPWPAWEREQLRIRRDCYQSTMDPRARQAQRDWAEFLGGEPEPLVIPASR